MTVTVKNLGNGIKNIKINDPKTYNSLSFATLSLLIKTFQKMDKDNSTRAVSYTHLTLPTNREV